MAGKTVDIKSRPWPYNGKTPAKVPAQKNNGARNPVGKDLKRKIP